LEIEKYLVGFILFCFQLRFSFITSKLYQLPMQKITTSLKKTDLFNEKKLPLNYQHLQPRAATLQNYYQPISEIYKLLAK
jgi:hypothetical protein